MGMHKTRARKLAREWWARHPERTSAVCDTCMADLAKGEGFLCSSLIGGITTDTGRLLADFRRSASLICERCFDANPDRKPFDGPIGGFKRWWQFWKK